jgi:hypothetical protein
MKYNININQLALSELSSNMDVVDAAILDYVIVLCNSQNEKIGEKRFKDKENNTWTWVDLQTLCEDMPLLRISSRTAISTRIKRIEENNFVKTTKRRVKGHICLYVKLDRKVDSLYVKLDRPVRENVQDPQKPVRETGPIINTNNTIHNNTSTLEVFDVFWEAYPSKKAKPVAMGSWAKIDPALYPVIIADVQKRSALDRAWLEGFIPHPSTYLNQQRWTDDITPVRGKALPAGTPVPEEGKYNKLNKQT